VIVRKIFSLAHLYAWAICLPWAHVGFVEGNGIYAPGFYRQLRPIGVTWALHMTREQRVLSRNCNIVHVDVNVGSSAFVSRNGLLINAIHHHLECRRQVSESKEHYGGFEQPLSHFEHCFVFIPLFDPYVVVTPPNI
jgi:hypothetical protein